jgi:sugar transport system substrate-binding protein
MIRSSRTSLKACAALATALLLATGARAEDKPMSIGAIYLDAQGFYAGVRKGVTDEITASGKPIKIIETNARGDIAKESAFINTLVSAPVGAIILSAVSTEGSLKAVKQAKAANIPVICYNTCLNDAETAKNVYAYVVGDPFTYGAKLGDAAADYFIKAGIKEPKIAVLNCEFVEVCVQRRKGFESGLMKKIPAAKIVANQEGTILDKAISTAEKMLISNPVVDAFMGESGGATLGAAKAVRNQKRLGKTVVFGCDMTTEIAQELIDNTVIKAEADVSGRVLGKLAAQQAMAAIGGAKRDKVLMPVNIDLYTSAEQAQAWLKGHSDGLP